MDQLGAMTEFFINVLGQSRADAEANAARAVQMDAYADWTNIDAPKLQTADLVEQGPAELSKYAEDPRLRGYQLKALDALGREVDSQGMTPEDQAAFLRARQQAGAMDAGFRGAAESRMAQRGMAGGMSDYLGSLASGQAATNRAADMGVQEAANSRERYLRALDALSNQASGVRGQDFGVASARAQAQDNINRFNASQRTQNQAYNLGLAQQDFENQMGLAAGRGGAANNIGGMLERRSARASRDAAKWGKATNDLIGGMGAGMLGGGK